MLKRNNVGAQSFGYSWTPGLNTSATNLVTETRHTAVHECSFTTHLRPDHQLRLHPARRFDGVRGLHVGEGWSLGSITDPAILVATEPDELPCSECILPRQGFRAPEGLKQQVNSRFFMHGHFSMRSSACPATPVPGTAFFVRVGNHRHHVTARVVNQAIRKAPDSTAPHQRWWLPMHDRRPGVRGLDGIVPRLLRGGSEHRPGPGLILVVLDRVEEFFCRLWMHSKQGDQPRNFASSSSTRASTWSAVRSST